MQTITIATTVCLAGMTLGASAAAATAVESASVTAVSLPHMPAASQAAPSSSPAANSPAPQAIQEIPGRTPADPAAPAVTRIKCIIMDTNARFALFVEQRNGDPSPGSPALTDI